LTLLDTAAMLRHRWMVAGGRDFPFTAEAVEAIHLHSQGIPRAQVILADNALLAAFVSGEKTVTDEHIRQAVADRALPDIPPLPAEPRITKRPVSASRNSERRSA